MIIEGISSHFSKVFRKKLVTTVLIYEEMCGHLDSNVVSIVN